MKILVFGFGTTPIFFKALIEKLNEEDKGITWSAILPTSHHLKTIEDLLGADQVLCLHPKLPSRMKGALDISLMANYPGNIFKDIETEKITLKHRNSERQLRTAIATYSLLKEFVSQMAPDHILYAQPPEGMDGMVLAGVANELGIPLAVPHHTRNIGLSFFSSNPNEILPSSTRVGTEDLARAECFLNECRNRHINPAGFQQVETTDEIVSHRFPSRVERVRGFIKRFWTEPENRELGMLRVSLLNSWFPIYRDVYRGLRKKVNSRHFNLNSLNQLPTKFIFYPLQYTPESSINVPAPYFIDQLRIIDAIRMAMPSDTLLVVKEHPSCIVVRPGSFVKKLLCTAGVVVAKYDLDTQEIIRRADLTISVTGTAAFEAFLTGRPSLVMGPTFFTEFLGGQCGLDELPLRIRQRMGRTVPDSEIITALARIYSVSSGFYGRAPGEVGGAMMTKNNIDEYWRAFITHTDRVQVIVKH